MNPQLSLLGVLSALLSVGYTFSDTSPYILASSSSPIAATSRYVASTSFVRQAVHDLVSRCSSDFYVLVSQPGLHASDLSAPHSVPHLRELLSSAHGHWTPENVFADGGIEPEEIVQSASQTAHELCSAEVDDVIDAKTAAFKVSNEMRPRVVTVEFERLPEAEEPRRKAVEQNDAFLHGVFEMLPPKNRWTLVYVSSPIGAAVPKKKKAEVEQHYENDELKRRWIERREDNSNYTAPAGGLFEKYQFFTPAIFMGYIMFFFLSMIVYVGLSALTSLKVSYGAFEKEMGPSAQAAKKQQ